MIAQGKSGNGPEEAFASQDRKIDRSKIECYNCHKKGHYKSECWAKGGDKEGQRPPRRSDNNDRRNNNRNRNNRNRDNNQGSDNANSANMDIEAWSAIEEIEEIQAAIEEIDNEFTDQLNYEQIAYSVGPQVHLPEIEIKLYDSGASRHMSPFIHCFSNYRPIPPRPITAANKHVFYAIGTGDLQIDVPNGQGTTPVTLCDTLHAPDMALTIVSIGRIVNSGCSVSFEKKSCKIKNKSGKVIGDIPASSNGLFKVKHSFIAASANTVEQVDIHTLHRRLGHISADAIRNLIRFNAITGIKLIDNGSPIICQSCEYAKLTRKPIKNERSAAPAKQFSDEIHTDLWGPSRTASLGGRRYYITFTDDHTWYTRIDILQTKDEALQAYRDFASWARTQHRAKIKALRSDRGGEYTGRAFTQFLQGEGTERRLTTHDTPQHNSVAESLNRRLLERVRAILNHSGLPKTLWAEALHFATWLKNRTSTCALSNNITPLEKLTGIKPNLSGVPE